MRELSLYSGAGGGLLATHYLLGWDVVGYIETDAYCQQVLAARIQDGTLPDAPIFGDIRAFIHRRGHARAYQGLVDVITAGFPCQPFSVAGKRRADLDSRNLWPQTRRCIGIVRPRWLLLENVPGLLAGSHGYFGRILGELAVMGYDARWGVISAAECGAPHLRKRLWIVAHAARQRAWRVPVRQGRPQQTKTDTDWRGADVPHPQRPGIRDKRERMPRRWADRICAQGHAQSIDDGQAGIVADAAKHGRHTRRESDRAEEPRGWESGGGSISKDLADAAGKGREGPAWAAHQGRDGFTAGGWWQAEPPLGRVADGLADRVVQLRALGNGQVPAVVARAWEELSR